MSKEKAKKVLKSRTFWGGFVFAVVNYVETTGLLPPEAVKLIEAVAVGVGLYGARNPKDTPAA